MRRLRVPALLGLLLAFAIPSAARADRPGRHPSYLHALTDLRTAREHLRHRGRDVDVRAAVDEVDAAIRDIEDAAVEVGKDLDNHPGVDLRPDDVGDLHRAADLLRKARHDISGAEDDPRARELRKHGFFHMDEAIRMIVDALEERQPPPPPREDVSESEPPPDDYPPAEEVTFEDAPDPEPVRSVYVEPPAEEPPPMVVRYLPPPMRYEPPPPMPEEGMYWVGGYWVWDDGEWAWSSGHWVAAPRVGWGWMPPYYETRGGVVIFVTGHWGPPGYVFRPPPPTFDVHVNIFEARPSYHGILVANASVSVGVFVPAPPGSRMGIVVPAPMGTPPQVVVGAPPVVRPGMVVRGNVNNTTIINNTTNITNVTVVAPAGVTRDGRAHNASVSTRPALAASLPPRAAVAPPPPPAAAMKAHPAAFSPVAANPPRAGQRQVLPTTVNAHPTAQTLQHRPPPGPATAGQPGGKGPGKVEPAKMDKPGAAKGEPGKMEPAKTEPAKVEPAKTQPPPKVEPAKTQPPPKAEPAKAEPPKSQPPPRAEPAKTEPQRTPPPHGEMHQAKRNDGGHGGGGRPPPQEKDKEKEKDKDKEHKKH